MTRYPMDQPLPPDAGLYRGGPDEPPFDDDEHDLDVDEGDNPDEMWDPREEAWRDERERTAWHHEMNEPDYHDDGDEDEPLPPEPAAFDGDDLSEQRILVATYCTTAELAFVLRQRGYSVVAPDPDADIHLNKTDTSQNIEPKMRENSLGAAIYEFYFADGGGWTVDEIEEITGRAHQSVSAMVNRLMRKGLIYDTGQRKNTRYGNPAIVWSRTMTDPIYTEGTQPS